MICPNRKDFVKLIVGIDKATEIKKKKENPLRYDVWGTTDADVLTMLDSLTAESLPEQESNSVSIFNKLKSTLIRIQKNPRKPTKLIEDLKSADDQDVIRMSIALHEMMESVKGEADKARGADIAITDIATEGVLPGMPTARIAASIGRKILFQQGYRIKNTEEDKKTPVDVEALYHTVGRNALSLLEDKGYVKFSEDSGTIKDYILAKDVDKAFQGRARGDSSVPVVTDTSKVSLVDSKFGISDIESQEALYFLHREVSDISNTELGAVTDALSAIRQITQPAKYRAPDKHKVMSNQDFREADDQNVKLGDTSHDVRKKLYEKPLKVHNAVHELLSLLHAEVEKTGSTATKILKRKYKTTPHLFRALFGVKNSDLFSIDKRESTAGQNLSKSTAIDDLAEYYNLLTENGDPSSLHLPMKVGRNERLYYLNSILNPHASKQSRYMLTAGEQTVEYNSDDFDYLVHQIGESLGGKYTYSELLEGTNKDLEGALADFARYNEADILRRKLETLSHLSKSVPDTDYVTILTALAAVNDIRNPSNGNITTEFTVAEDATASGGTLSFLQALGTNPNVKGFLERIGLLVDDKGNISTDNVDLYTLMTEEVENFLRTEGKDALAEDAGVDGKVTIDIITDTLDLLFNNGEDVREFSKSPTMTFVYQQGEEGSIDTIATSIADRVIDSLETDNTKEFLVKLLGKAEYKKMNAKSLNSKVGLYKDVKDAIIVKGLPKRVHNLLNTAIKDKFLKEHQVRSQAIFGLVEKVMGSKVVKLLPADAVLDGKKAEVDLADAGMPIAKIMEIMTKLPDGTDVITRKEILYKTIMDVSAIHGIDSALLYHSLDAAKFDKGVVVVHDEVRGSIKDVRRTVENYTKKAKQVLDTYDIHEQMLESLKAHDPEVVNDPEYKALVEDVQKTLAEKRSISKNFNDKTAALIGSGDAYKTFAKDKKVVTPKAEPKKPKAVPTPKVMHVLKALSSESELIKTFIGSFDTRISEGTEFAYKASTDTITVDSSIDLNEETKEKIEHEIVHAATAARIHKALKEGSKSPIRLEVQYFAKSIKALTKSGKGSKALKERVTYINAQATEEASIAEFVAIMLSEKEIANEVYQVLDTKGRLKGVLNSFVKSVHRLIAKITSSDFDKDIDPVKLYGALNRTLELGISDRANNQALTVRILSGMNQTFGFKGKMSASNIDFLNKAVARMITDRAEESGKNLLVGIHRNLKDYDVYSGIVDKLSGVYDSSEGLQQVMSAITGKGVSKKKKAVALAEYAKATSQRNDFISKNLGDFDEITNKMSKEDNSTLEEAITKIPLHTYFVEAEHLNTAKAIDSEVDVLEKTLAGTKALKDVNDLVNLNEGKVTGSVYNLALYSDKDSKHAGEVRRLLALKSIQAVGTEKFLKLLKNDELKAMLNDQVMANYLSLVNVGGRENLRANSIPHSYAEGIQRRSISLEELSSYTYGDNTGWKVVTPPTKTALGLVYRETIDSTVLPGIFTDIKMASSDIVVTPESNKYTNVVKTPTGFRRVITDEERKAMGSLSAVHSLVRSTAHSIVIQETQIIRDTIVEGETTFTVNKSNKDSLKDMLEDDSVDNPWFLKADGITYTDLPAKVKARYMPVGDRASDVKGFNEEVTWVRKDSAHWLMGGTSSSPFQDPKYKWALRITKDLVAMSKIGMVILNPGKIARDNISNVVYLGVMGVPPVFAFNNYKEIMAQFGTYTEDKNELLALKVKLIANPESSSLKAKEKSLRNKLKRNPITSIEDKGFLNSLGSSLISRESETLGGTQKDVNTALTYLLKQKDGKNNYLSHFLMQVQKAGFQGEDFLVHLGDIVGKSGAGKEFEAELDKVHDRLSRIRSEKDVVAYASQFINSPQSEAVRVGASITDLSDVLAKETYYRHLVGIGVKPEEAKIKVLDSFPNYTENMPMAIQQASDVGVLMFPSFWLRIQKVIYRMAKEKPLSLATEEALDVYLHSNLDSIVGSNIVNKATSWGGIIHSPYENMGTASIFPEHLF